MKITNRIGYADEFMRRLTVWTCREIGIASTKVALVEFKKRTRLGWRGYAYYSRPYRVTVSVGPLGYPFTGHSRGSKQVVFTVHCHLEMVVKVLAHELKHLHYFQAGKHDANNETDVQLAAVRVLKKFQEQKAELVTEWQSKAVAKRVTKPKLSLVEQRAAKAAKALALWQRKAKLAATKLKKYKQQVRYYERKQAAEKS